jgi:AcrR family transcriptional regulator/ferredoxin
MGRVAGVTAFQTRERLLRAAAEVFATRGYDGTRVADIASTAGVSNGALYAHFGSKAELLVAALRTHGRRMLADLFADDPDRSVTDLLLTIGRWLPRRRDASGYLIVEALVAARRDQEVSRLMRDYVGERAAWIAGLINLAQGDGEVDPDLSPGALAHFCLLLAMGSALVTPDLHGVGDDEWTALLTRVIGSLAPAAERPSERSAEMRLRIDSDRCQGHGRCYDLVPELFGDDDEGYGQVLHDVVPQGREADARRAAANCPERAIEITEET